jgi:hypothetical protein
MMYKTLHRKLQIKKPETVNNRRYTRRVHSSCSTSTTLGPSDKSCHHDVCLYGCCNYYTNTRMTLGKHIFPKPFAKDWKQPVFVHIVQSYVLFLYMIYLLFNNACPTWHISITYICNAYVLFARMDLSEGCRVEGRNWYTRFDEKSISINFYQPQYYTNISC